MSSPAAYYRRRRKQLRKLRRCLRCGEFPASEGHSLCAVCLEEKKFKRADPPSEKHRLQKRITEIEEIRRRLLERAG